MSSEITASAGFSTGSVSGGNVYSTGFCFQGGLLNPADDPGSSCNQHIKIFWNR